MSNPSFSNIDLWLFELAEGNLSQTQVEQLELFLLQNPDLDVDRDMWEMAKVSTAGAVVYPDQAGLGREKPKRRFALIGSSALLLMTLVGCISYLGSDSSDWIKDGSSLTAGNGYKSLQEKQLLSEIDELKATIASLENQVANSKNSNDLTNSSNPNPTSLNEFSASTNLVSEVSSANVQNGSLASNTNRSSGNGTNGSGLTANNGTEPVVSQNGATGIEVSNSPIMNPLISSANTKNLGMLAEATVEHIKVKETEYIPTATDSQKKTVRTSPTEWAGIGAGGYHKSFKNRLSKVGRNIQRMMDNPIALKNSRDPHYHVPGKSSQDLNFGSVGTLIAPRVSTLSRLQWYGEANEQFTNQVAVDAYSYAVRGGIGIQLNHSLYNKGGLQVSDVAFTYSPKISVSRKISIEPSFRFKMGNKFLSDKNMDDATQVEIDRGNVHDYYADGSQPVGKSLWYKDMGFGLNVNTKWFFASAQLDNAFNHRDNIYSNTLVDPRRAGTQFVATLGTDWENRKENMTLSPYIVYQKNEQLSEAWLGLNYRINWFSIGGAISSNLDPAASIGVKLKHFSIHYNSDYTYSLMNDNRALSHQLTLRFVGKPNRFGKRLLNL